MRICRILICLGLLMLGSSAGLAGPITTFTYSWGTATIVTSLGPNLFCTTCNGYSEYISNAIADLQVPGSQSGNFNTDPGAYNIVNSVNPADNLVTNYPSWRSAAPATTPFDNEEGSRLFFGLFINDTTSTFSLSNLSFVITSTDTNHYFAAGQAGGLSGNFSANSYRPDLEGINTGTSTTYTSGVGSQAVNKLVYVGISPAYNYADAPVPTSLSSAITAADGLNGGANYNIQVCYSVSGLFSNACATITETPSQTTQEFTPEPGTSGLFGFGLACMLVMGRRLAKRLRS